MNIKPSIRGSFFPFSCAILAAAGLTACDSQQDDISAPVIGNTTVTPGGIYLGTKSPQDGSASTPVVALIDDSSAQQQHIVIFATSASFLSSGLVTTVGTGITAQSRYFDLTATTPAAAAAQTESLTGSYVEKSQVGAQYTRDNSTGTPVGSGTLSLTYQAADYEVPSMLSSLAGSWANTDAFGTATAFFSLDANGVITGQTTANNCNYNGNAGIIDQTRNLYSIKLNENCSSTNSSDVLTGLATILPASTATNNTQPQLVIGVASPSAGQLFRLTMMATP